MKTTRDFALESFMQLAEILNSALAEQRSAAHHAIDMEDWEQGQEILEIANSNMSVLNVWKNKLEGIKTEMMSSSFFMKTQTEEARGQANTEMPEMTTEMPKGQTDNACESAPRIAFICNHEYAVQNWGDVIVKVCEDMMLRKPYAMALINQDMQQHFASNESDARRRMANPKRLSNGLWVETGDADADISALAYKVISWCGYSQSDLIIR